MQCLPKVVRGLCEHNYSAEATAVVTQDRFFNLSPIDLTNLRNFLILREVFAVDLRPIESRETSASHDPNRVTGSRRSWSRG